MSSLVTSNVLRYGRTRLGVRGYAHNSRPTLALMHGSPSRTLLKSSVPLTRSAILCGPNLSFSRNLWASSSNAPSPQVQTSAHVAEKASTENVESVASASMPDVTVLPVPTDLATAPVDASSAIAEAASNVMTPLADIANVAGSIPPMQFGDLAALGLAGWSPAGIIRWSFELINVTTHMPWFWTFVAGAAFWRVVVAPFTIESIRNSARLLPKTEQMKALTEEKNKAVANRDNIALQKVMLKQKALYDEAGVSMGKMALTPFIQLPVTLGMFFGVRTMCEYPVEQLTWSGVDFLANLTVPDPTYILPLVLTAVINIQITAGAKDMNLAERPEMGHVMNGLRVLSLAGTWILMNLPAGLQLTLFVSSLFTALQSYAIRQPAVRRALGIPIIPVHLQGKLPTYKESWEWVKGYYGRKIEDAKTQAVAQQKLQEAARHKIRR